MTEIYADGGEAKVPRNAGRLGLRMGASDVILLATIWLGQVKRLPGCLPEETIGVRFPAAVNSQERK